MGGGREMREGRGDPHLLPSVPWDRTWLASVQSTTLRVRR